MRYYSLNKVVWGYQLFCHKYQYLPDQETWGRKTTHNDRFNVNLGIVLTAKFIESREEVFEIAEHNAICKQHRNFRLNRQFLWLQKLPFHSN